MLLIKTYLKETDGKGIGLFAGEKIAAQTMWHKDEELFDRKFSKQFVIENGLEKYFYHYATYHLEEDCFYLCSDNARFVNHSETPNTYYDKNKGGCFALMDIEEGEEITCDYRTICDDSRVNGLDFELK